MLMGKDWSGSNWELGSKRCWVFTSTGCNETFRDLVMLDLKAGMGGSTGISVVGRSPRRNWFDPESGRMTCFSIPSHTCIKHQVYISELSIISRSTDSSCRKTSSSSQAQAAGSAVS